MSLRDVRIGKNAPEIVNAVIEIPRGDRNKYEYDEQMDVIKLDRVQYTAMACPQNYVFIPDTHCEDGDHLDGFLFSSFDLTQACVVEARVIGVIYMDDGGEQDDKVLLVPVEDMRFDQIQDISDLAPHLIEEIIHYLKHYKDIKKAPGIVEITGHKGKEQGVKVVVEAINAYDQL
ncbi:inorganic diphosphatase [Candidatus Saccharibacteria bacterium]|nr:inorganic diphosphatase [Candidatus Saccharibacteria bacterium]